MAGSLDGRVALVTGASRGIGAATAFALAAAGAHPVLLARTQGGLEETDDAIRAVGGEATLLKLDLADAAAIDAVGPTLHARFGRLDILVHAAAVLGLLTPTAQLAPRDLDRCIAVNLVAAARLIRTAAPLLQAADAGRAVFLTSSVAHTPRAFWAAYGATKAAMENLVLAWADETDATAMRVNLFDPGRTATRLRAMAFPGEDPRTLPTPDQAASALLPLCLATETRTGARVSARSRP